MPFASGHRKIGGRKAGTPNRATAAARQLALAMLGDLGEYAANARERIWAGKAPRLETKALEYLVGPPRPVETRNPLMLDLHEELEEDFDVGDAFEALGDQAPRPAGDTPPPAAPRRQPVRDDAPET
jgi:hypothetical protein